VRRVQLWDCEDQVLVTWQHTVLRKPYISQHTKFNIFLVDFLSKIMNAKNFRNKVHQIWLSIWYLWIFCERMQVPVYCYSVKFGLNQMVKQNFKQHAKDWIRHTRNYPSSLRKKYPPLHSLAFHGSPPILYSFIKTLFPYIWLEQPQAF